MPDETRSAVAHLYLTNLAADDQEIEAQFNPTQFSEELAANWTTLTVPGAPVQPLQFSNTENFKIKMELFFLALTPAELKRIHRARLLLLAWCYPRAVAADIIGGAAPRILVTWPGMLSLEAVLRDVNITHQRFNKWGQSVHYTASITLEEATDVLLNYESVAADEDIRLGGPTDISDEAVAAAGAAAAQEAASVRTRRRGGEGAF